jgi:predicted DNA-binding transcriptional regulator AlpA
MTDEQNETPRADRVLLTAPECAKRVRLSEGAFWKAVRDGRLPWPVYPAPRAPRWFDDELDAALEQTRELPTASMARRRARMTVRPSTESAAA